LWRYSSAKKLQSQTVRTEKLRKTLSFKKAARKIFCEIDPLVGDSKNFLLKLVRVFVTLGLKILRLFEP